MHCTELNVALSLPSATGCSGTNQTSSYRHLLWMLHINWLPKRAASCFGQSAWCQTSYYALTGVWTPFLDGSPASIHCSVVFHLVLVCLDWFQVICFPLDMFEKAAAPKWPNRRNGATATVYIWMAASRTKTAADDAVVSPPNPSLSCRRWVSSSRSQTAWFKWNVSESECNHRSVLFLLAQRLWSFMVLAGRTVANPLTVGDRLTSLTQPVATCQETGESLQATTNRSRGSSSGWDLS